MDFTIPEMKAEEQRPHLRGKRADAATVVAEEQPRHFLQTRMRDTAGSPIVGGKSLTDVDMGRG